MFSCIALEVGGATAGQDCRTCSKTDRQHFHEPCTGNAEAADPRLSGRFEQLYCVHSRISMLLLLVPLSS